MIPFLRGLAAEGEEEPPCPPVLLIAAYADAGGPRAGPLRPGPPPAGGASSGPCGWPTSSSARTTRRSGRRGRLSPGPGAELRLGPDGRVAGLGRRPDHDRRLRAGGGRPLLRLRPGRPPGARPEIGLARELIEDRNLGLGIALAGYLIASGLLIHGVMMGQGGGLLVSLVFFAIAQRVLLALGPVYGRIAGLDLQAQLRSDNVAVGLAYGGCFLGLGRSWASCSAGDFIDWRDLAGQLPRLRPGRPDRPAVVRWLADLILAPGVQPQPGDRLREDRPPNLAAGMIEAASYIAAGLIVAWSLS